MLQRDVRSMGAIVRTATAPSKFNSADKVDKQKTYNDMLSSAPLIRARTEEEAIELRNKLPWLRESVYYDNFSQMVTKLTLERRGLELFQSWMQIELEKVDQKIQSKFSADKSWSAITQGRSSKNADDLMRISLTEYQELRSRFEDGYKSFHFSTAQDALDALGKAQISYRFIFTLRAGLQGLDRRFIFDPQG